MIQDAKWIRANCECPTFQKKLFIGGLTITVFILSAIVNAII